MIKNQLRYAVATAFFLASAASNVAFAVPESENPRNDSISTAQSLVIGDSGRIEVEGIIGIDTVGTPVPDVDFYSFYGRAGDTVTVNIDNGDKVVGRRLDSLIAIFAPDGTVLRQRNNVGDDEVDGPGSISGLDPRIDKVNLPVSGTYTVGVTSDATYPADGTMRFFLTGGSTSPYVRTSMANGSYKLIIEVIAPQLLQIGIDIKPGAKEIATKINPKSKRKVKVALLSSENFDATKADRASITFGPEDGPGTSGLCGKTGTGANNRKDDDDDDDDDDDKDRKAVKDVNRDGRLDLVCRFEIRAAGFDESDTEGLIKGKIDGMSFEGRGWLKVIPVKKKRHND